MLYLFVLTSTICAVDSWKTTVVLATVSTYVATQLCTAFHKHQMENFNGITIFKVVLPCMKKPSYNFYYLIFNSLLLLCTNMLMKTINV